MSAFAPDVLAGALRWTVAVALLAAAGWRWGRGMGRPTNGAGERAMRALLVVGAAMVGSVVVLGFAGALGGWTLVIVALVLWLVARRAAPATRPPRPGWRWPVHWPWAVALVPLAADGLLALAAPPSNWDAMTYHLYLPARWIQAGRILHVPTVFADDLAAYAPQNGAALFAWTLATAGHDALANVLQGVFALAAGLAVAGIVRELLPAAGRRGAALAGSLVVLLPLLRRWAFTANVDVLQQALFLLAVHWALGYGRRGDRGTLAASGLAAGLALGTKSVGPALVALPLVLAAAPAAAGRRWRDLGLLLVTVTLGGGWWLLRNLALYGNPLFPLDTTLLGVHFAGAFTAEALVASLFHLSAEEWWASLRAAVGLPTCAVVAAGWLAWVADALRRRERRLVRLALAAFVPLWVALVFALPYNNQMRFLVPAAALSCLGWGALAADRRLPRGAVAAAWGVAALVLVAPWTSVGEWAAVARARLAIPLPEGAAAALTAAVALATGTALLRRRGGLARAAGVATGVAAAALALSVVTARAESLRPHVTAAEDYRIYWPGIAFFQNPGLPPLDVAYTGFNLPYTLVGPGLRHRVVYVDTRGDQGDGFYEHWRRDPRLHDAYRPGIYRGPDDDPARWLARLRALGIDAVAVFALFPVERPAHWPLDGDFPIERRWLRERPDLFVPVVRAPRAEVYLRRDLATPRVSG